MLTVDDANEAKCERKPEMNHPVYTPPPLHPSTSSSHLRATKLALTLSPPLSQTANCI